MTALTTTASLVGLSALDEGSRITASLERKELETMLAGTGEAQQLWFDVGVEGEAEPQRLTVELTHDDLRALLAEATGDEVTLALSGTQLADLLDEPDVEAHGLRAALAISVAVATGAIAGPAMAATPQVSTASVGTAAASQQVEAAATTQVTRQIVSSQATNAAAKTQRTAPVKFKALTILRAGVSR